MCGTSKFNCGPQLEPLLTDNTAGCLQQDLFLRPITCRTWGRAMLVHPRIMGDNSFVVEVLPIECF